MYTCDVSFRVKDVEDLNRLKEALREALHRGDISDVVELRTQPIYTTLTVPIGALSQAENLLAVLHNRDA